MIKTKWIFLLSIFSFLLVLQGCGPSKYVSAANSYNNDSSNLGTITSATSCFQINNLNSENIDTDLKSFLINYQNKEFAILLFMKLSNCDINQLYQVTVSSASGEQLKSWMLKYSQSLYSSNVSDNDQKNLPIINKYFTQAIKNTLTGNYPNLPLNQIIQNNISDIYRYIDSQGTIDPKSDIAMFKIKYQQSADLDSGSYHVGWNMIGDVSQKDISNNIINSLSITLRQLSN